MIDFTNLDEIKKLDPKDVYGSTGMFVNQCRQIWEDAKSLKFSQDYSTIDNIVICGMGGSAYGGYVVKTLFKDSLKVPIISNNDYHLPAFVNPKSLIILSSYSGSTEEVLSCASEAKSKGLKITGITGGGKLGEFLSSQNLPHIKFDTKFNPSGQPRLGTGYMVLGTISILNNLGVISLSNQEIENAISELKNSQEEIKTTTIDISSKFEGFIPIIFAAEHLVGNAHVLRNQFNETSKSFSAFEDLPELNHHLMEGLKNPKDRKLKALFISSGLYSNTSKKRVGLTKDVVGKNGIDYLEVAAKGSSKLSQMLYVLSFGGYLTFYLAILYGQDPSLIPWVEYFKAELAKL